ncbi:hypothetical protein FQN57_000328 [Myotisia sp. PD_48]|nr:hypothetical protein FQN57_000328 [Myotisia sp. PD_48]
MARLTRILAPTTESLPDNLRIPSSTPHLIRTLSKLSRASLILLVLQWLDAKNTRTCDPYLRLRNYNQIESDQVDDENDIYPPAESIEELRAIYDNFKERKGGKREIIDRILEGDWRHGLSLRQLAMADVRYIEEHPACQRWNVFKLESSTKPISKISATTINDDTSTQLPRLHSLSFLRALQREIAPLVKAHYHVYRFQSLPLTLIRIVVTDTPYQSLRQSSRTIIDPSRLIYLAFPDSTPFIYSSLSTIPGSLKDSPHNTYSTGIPTLRRIINDAIPKALSRPRQRYSLTSCSLVAKSLHTLLTLRGPWKTNNANGAFTVFADAVAETGPLEQRQCNLVRPKNLRDKNPSSITTLDASNDQENQPYPGTKKKRPLQNFDTTSAQTSKKAKLSLVSRFGTAGDPIRIYPSLSSTNDTLDSNKNQSLSDPSKSLTTYNAALDRLQIYLQDTPSHDSSIPTSNSKPNSSTTLSLTFTGSDVIAGLRQLADLGIIDAARMPSWMTGEEAVSTAIIRNGKRIL